MKMIEELGATRGVWRVERLWRSYWANVTNGPEMVAREVKLNNAALIAAAPELYECLRIALDDYCRTCWLGNVNHCEVTEMCPCRKWREALKKAGGETAVNS